MMALTLLDKKFKDGSTHYIIYVFFPTGALVILHYFKMFVSCETESLNGRQLCFLDHPTIR